MARYAIHIEAVNINLLEDQGSLHDATTQRTWFVLQRTTWHEASGIGHPEGLSFRVCELPAPAMLCVGRCKVLALGDDLEQAMLFQEWSE